MFCDFLTVGMDQLVNQAAKMRYMFGGKISLPMVVRLPCGAGVGAAAQHSQSLEAWMTHVPGLKVVYPSTPQDALGLMLSSIDDDNPVMFFEHKAVYALKGDVESFEPIPLGKGDIKREGSDVTVIATGKMVYEALAAAEKLAAEGISARVIDMHTIKPLDTELVLKAAKETGAIVTTEEANVLGGLGAAVAEYLGETYPIPVVRHGVNDEFGRSGKAPLVLDAYGINADGIAAKAKQAIAMKK